MDQNRQVDVGTLLSTVASMLMQNQDRLNEVDTGPRGGTHGERMAQAFQAAAEAARRADTQDAGEQFAFAAQAMRQQGRGKAAGFYANGLEQAASQFQGQSGISSGNLLPLLQSLLGGVQQGNPAQPGQGTIIDALLPAVSAFMGARQQGRDDKSAAMEALTSAISGARGTARRQGQERANAYGSQIDPGAASATSVLGGIVSALMPGVLSAVSGSGAADQMQSPAQRDYHSAPEQPDDPLGGLGGLVGALGGFAGGGQPDERQQGRYQPSEGGSSTGSWWPF